MSNHEAPSLIASRRSVLKGFGFAAMALAVPSTLAACGSSSGSSSGGKSIVVADGGGDYQKALIKAIYEPFEKKTGIKVVPTVYDYSLGALEAQVKGGKQWDAAILAIAADEKKQSQLLLPIDYDVVKPAGMREVGKTKYQAKYSTYSNVLSYRTDKYDEAPTAWADMWDVGRFPGPRTLGTDPRGTLEIALMADGVAYADLYPLDVDRALAKLTELVDISTVAWWDSGAKMIQNFVSGVATIGGAWNGRMISAKAEGAPVDFVVDQALVADGSWGVLKTSKNPEGAMQFINYLLAPEQRASEMTAFPGNGCFNDDAFALLTPELRESLPDAPGNADKWAGYVDWTWWDANYADTSKAFQSWYAKI